MCLFNPDCVASLSCLPGDLLVQILSLLPTKQAVSTSLLSKRWRTLFAFRHNLDFDDSIFWHPEKDKRDRDDIQNSFWSFVSTRTLAALDGNHLKSFSLKCYENCHQGLGRSSVAQVDHWILNVLKHGVSELHLCIESGARVSFQSDVFTSTTLVKLTLGAELGITDADFPCTVYLPALKVLFLDSIWFDANLLSHVLLAGCPALEDLTIHQAHSPGARYDISSKTIKRLSVTYKTDYYADWGGIILLDTPSLVDLYYYDCPRLESPRCHLDSLAKATLSLHFLENDKDEQLNSDVTSLISGIRNVKTLHLTSSSVEVISLCCKDGLPVFKNLVELVFSSGKKGWKVFLPLLLERSPNLKTLVLSDLHRYTFRRRRFVGIRIPP